MLSKKINSLGYIFILFLFSLSSSAQYNDHIGAGNDIGISITASSFEGSATPNKTMNGSGLDAARMEASRFLLQASLGANMNDIDQLVDMGFEDWFDHQSNLPISDFTTTMEDIYDEIYQMKLDSGLEEEDIGSLNWLEFTYAWWQIAVTKDDVLRQRIAFALSQILVISMESDLGGYGDALSTYYDLLMFHAFGNYEDLLLEVTTSMSMGSYLSHLNNPKEDLENNVHPDENYAREIMQLFTIGLYELNLDASWKLDSDGNPIPTYDNDDIKELAQVFTGLSAGGITDMVTWTDQPYFGLGLYGGDRKLPMIMYDEYHDQSSKELIGGVTLPAGQDGMTDVEQAVSHLFNHPNVGPFVCRQLIQRLIKSNPTSEYIERVATVFNDNGSGVRGDLKAVFKAILLDPEARTCGAINNDISSRLKEPVIKYTQMARGLELISPYGRYWNSGYDFMERTGQLTLASPTVFNFYTPDFQPNGAISDANLVAPEFKLHNSKNAIDYINKVYAMTVWNSFMYSWENDYGDETIQIDYEAYRDLAADTEDLINHFDIVFTYGQMSDELRNTLRTALNGLLWGDVEEDKIRMGLYLVFISPDFNITR